MQINIPLDPGALSKAIDGNKTYLALLVAALVVAANHFGFLPPEYTPANLDPGNWVNDEFKLLLAFTGRSALKKLEGTDPAAAPASAPDPQKTGT